MTFDLFLSLHRNFLFHFQLTMLSLFSPNLLLSTSINLLWGMINALQIIGSLSSFNLYIPANVIDFYGFINNIQTFNFIPTDKIFASLSLARDQNEESNFISSNSTRNLNEKNYAAEDKDSKSLF